MGFCRKEKKQAGLRRRGATRPRKRTPVWLFSLLAWLAFSGSARAFIIINAPMTNTNSAGWVLGGSPASAYLTGTGGAAPAYDPANQGWLRLTNTATNQTGFAYNTTSFDLSAGVLIQFDYASWGGSNPGADGTSVFLFDSNVAAFNIGAFGGSLGYAQKLATNNPICNGGVGASNVAGISGGYVGIGLDEYGNYAACNEGRYEGWNSNSGNLDGNTVTIRGPVSGFGGGAVGATLGASSYPWVYTSGSTTANGGLYTNGGSSRPSQSGTGYRKVIIQITPAPNPQISTWIQFGYNTIPVQVVSSQPLPAISASQTLMVGFGASTGSLDNYHDVRNLMITTLGENTSVDLGITKTAVASGTANQITSVGAGASFQYLLTASNFGPNDIFASGVGVTDSFPASVSAGTWSCSVVSPGTTGMGTTSCPTPSSGTISGNSLNSSVNLSKGGSVAFTVNATVPSVPAGNSVSNTASLTIPGAITDYYSGDDSATSTLGVYLPLALTKTFSPTTATSTTIHPTMTVTLTNPNTFAVSGVAFSDTYPGGLTNNTAAANGTPSCGGTVTGAANTGTLALTGGSIPANSSCVITGTVKGTTVGTAYTNTIPVGALTTTTQNIPNTVAAAATFDILSALAAPTQVFAPAAIGVNGTSLLTITLPNANALPITGATFTDTLPANLVTSGTASTTCSGGTLTTTSGSVGFSAGTSIPAGGCTVTVNVTSSVGNVSYSNPGIALTTTNDGTATGAAAQLTVLKLPTVAKTFAAPTIVSGGSTMTAVTLSNPNTIATLTGAAFTDSFPANLLTSGSATATGCGAGATAAATNNGSANGVLTLTGATITNGTNCVVSVLATGTTPGSYVNATGPVTTSNAGSGSSASSGALVVMAPPTLSKSFSPTSVTIGGSTALSITMNNPNPVTISGAQFTDSYPSGMTNITTGTTSQCGGTATATNGTPPSLAFSGGTIPANGSCTVTENVTISAAQTYANTIAAGGLTTANSGSNLTAVTANLNGPQPPTLTKSFSPSSIVAGSTATMTVSIANPNAFNLTSTAFSDSYPAGLVNTTAAAFTAASLSAGCAGTVLGAVNSGTLSLAGGTIPANSSCSITVSVTSPSTGGTLTNTTSTLTTAQAPAGNAASGSIFVTLPPTVTKSFSPTAVTVNVPSTLTITLTNPPTNTAAVTGVSFTDSYPGGGALVNFSSTAVFDASSSPGCSGTVTGTSGSSSLALSGGSIPVGGVCVLKIPVTSATAGSFINSTGSVVTGNAGTAAAATATLTTTLQAAPTVTKAFSPATIATGGSSTLTISLTNPSANALPITGVGFTDSYPAVGAGGKLVNTTTAAFTGASVSAGCSGNVTGAINANSLALSGGTIPANTTCNITVNLTSSTAGTYNNSTGPVTSGNAAASAGASALLGVLAQPTVTDSFVPSSVPITTASTLTIAITNPNASDITGASFTDSYSLVSGVGSLVNSSTPNAQFINQTTGGSCSGAVTATAGASSLVLSSGVIPANTTCILTVSVNSTGNTNNAIGSYQNSVTVTSANAPNSAAQAAQLATTVLLAPTLAKSFNPTSVPADGAAHTSVLTITLTNPTANTAAITGVTGSGGSGLIDSFPAGMTTAPAATLTNSCGGSGTLASGSISLSGGTVAANSSCTLSTTVQVTTSTAGKQYQNTTNYVTTSDATPSTATSNTAILTAAALTAPTVTKSFANTQIGLNVSTTMTIAMTNPASNSGAITGVNFTDSYPGAGALFNTSTTSAFDASSSAGCSGSVAGSSGGASLTLSGGSIPVGGTCVIKISVASATAGGYINNITVNTANAGNVSTSATLNVLQPLSSVTKSFSQNILAGGTATLTVTLSNLNNGIAVTGVGFTDNYPINLFNTAALSASTTCTGGVATAANVAGSNGTLTLSGATIPGGGSCAVTATVTSSVLGSYTNTITTVNTGNAGTVTGVSGNIIVLMPAPTVTKTFTANQVTVNTPSNLAITIVNNGSNALTGVSFTDLFPTTPGSLVVAATPNHLNNSCGGTLTTAGGASVTPGVSSLFLTGGTIAANSSCTVQVDVVTSTVGSYTNSSGQVTSSNAATAGSASAGLTVYYPPLLSILKSANTATGNPGDVITYTVLVVNTGAGTTGSNSVVLTDSIGPYLSFGVGSLKFTDGSPSSGLTFGTPQYSNDGGATWAYAPTGLFDALVTNWKVTMNGAMNSSGAKFTLTYTGQIH